MKTLKDIIEEHDNEFRLPGETDDWSEIEMFLKKEAREWIKELDKTRGGESIKLETWWTVTDWIKHFFNLDEMNE